MRPKKVNQTEEQKAQKIESAKNSRWHYGTLLDGENPTCVYDDKGRVVMKINIRGYDVEELCQNMKRIKMEAE